MTNEKHYKVCFHCGHFVNEEQKDAYCAYCGKSLKNECPTCQEKIYNPLAKFCPNCGYSYSARVSKAQQKEL